MDTFFDTIDILEIARQIRVCSPRRAVMILSEQEDEEWPFQAIKVGAAYSTRNITAEELVDAICKVSQSEYLITDELLSQPHLAHRVLQSFREIEILGHIAGNSNTEIAKLLGISDQTVKPYHLDPVQIEGERPHCCRRSHYPTPLDRARVITSRSSWNNAQTGTNVSSSFSEGRKRT